MEDDFVRDSTLFVNLKKQCTVKPLDQKRNMCVSGYIPKKIRVGGSLLNFIVFLKLYLLFSLILQEIQQMHSLPEVIQ